jgi:TRAP-type C4-dicarboxylate transport system permease small subunit
MPMFPENSLTFWLISSGICLFIGGLFAVGSWQQWSVLGGKNA